MKMLLTLFILLALPVLAHAESLHPPGWSENGNNKSTGNGAVAGNKVWTREEMKDRKTNGRNASWFSSGEKPTLQKNSAGGKQLKNALNRNLGKQDADALWSHLND